MFWASFTQSFCAVCSSALVSRPCILSLALDLARQLYIKRRIQAVTLKSVNKLLTFSILIKLAILSTSRSFWFVKFSAQSIRSLNRKSTARYHHLKLGRQHKRFLAFVAQISDPIHVAKILYQSQAVIAFAGILN